MKYTIISLVIFILGISQAVKTQTKYFGRLQSDSTADKSYLSINVSIEERKKSSPRLSSAQAYVGKVSWEPARREMQVMLIEPINSSSYLVCRCHVVVALALSDP